MKFPLLISKIMFLLALITAAQGQELLKPLQKFMDDVASEYDQISPERKDQLHLIADYMVEEISAGRSANLMIICTHNSRRSQMSQLWLQTAASYYGLHQVKSYSGGLEATAFNPNAVDAMKRAGFKISPTSSDKNPVYSVENGVQTMLASSKIYTEVENANTAFGAVMVCSDADGSCPIVAGADARFSLPYDDPRHFDHTPSEKAAYDKTCREIARAMMYLTSTVKMRLAKAQETAR